MLLRSLLCFVLATVPVISAQTPIRLRKAPSETTTPSAASTVQISPAQRAWEKKFQDGIVPGNIRENMRRLSARPHHVGSPYDKDNAEWILSKFKEAGFRSTN